MQRYNEGIAHVAPEDETVTPENIRKWKVLESLQNRNEVLFYKILLDNFEAMAPIVYVADSPPPRHTHVFTFRFR